MKVAAELMTQNPTIVSATASVRDAVALFRDLEVRHLPVVNDDGELVGMLSDRDLRGLSFPSLINEEWLGTIQSALDAQVSSLMTSDVLFVDAETDISEVIDRMLEHKIGAVPVVDAEGLLAGIVSYVDVLRAAAAAELEVD